MLKLYIQGMVDGKKEFTLSAPVEETGLEIPEFFGLVRLEGIVHKLGNQFAIEANAECDAKLVCDISLEEYIEKIKCSFNISVKADNIIPEKDDKNEIDNIYEFHIGSEEKEIDLTELTLEELAVNIPMKRIAPALRGKEFKDIHPEFSAEANKLNTDDERWSKLKNLKFN